MHQFGRFSGVLAVSAGLILTGCKRDPNVQKQKYLESGKRYESEGKLREAAIQFSNALKVDHNFGEAYYQMGRTYIAMGNPIAGYQQLLRAVDLAPSNVQARIDLGGLLVFGGAPDKALAQANAVLAINPNNADAYALLSRIDEKKGEHVQARADIEHALLIDPRRADFHTSLGVIESESGPADPAAVQELQKAVALDPKNTVAHLVFASLLEKKGDVPGAEQQGQLAIEQAPKNLQAYLSLAGTYNRAGNKEKTEQTLHQATEQLSDSDAGAELLKDYYVRTGQRDRAEPVYAELVSKYPKSVPLKVAYSRILLAKPDYARAHEVVDELFKKNGGNPQVVLLRALLLLHDGKADEAYALVQKATKNTPDNAQLQLMQAELATAKGDLNTAQTSYQQAAKLEPASVRAQAGIADIAAKRGDFTLLAQVADKMIAAHPEFADGYLWRGTAEANQKQEGAEADLQTALKKNPNSAGAYLALGQLKLRQQHVPEGKALLEQALQHDAKMLNALNILVSYDLAAKDTAKAQSRVEEQIAKSPNSSALFTLLARVQLSLKNFSGAHDNAAKALQFDPYNRAAVQVYAEAEMGAGNIDQAIATWKTWTDKHQGDASATTVLGVMESAKGETAKAEEYYKKALQLDPAQPIAANNLAYLMVENGQNVDVALTLAQTARRTLTNAPGSADTLAWVYYYKGTYASARDLLEDALKQDPNNASIHYHLGMVYSKLNDKGDAEMHLKKAVSLAPNTQTAKRAGDALTHLG